MSTATWDAALFERQRPYKTTIHAPRSMLLAQRIAATAAPAALTPCYFATAEFCATLLSLLLGALLVILTIVLPNPHFRMQESTRCFSLGVVSCFTLQLLLSNGPGSFVIQACAAVGSFPLAKDLAYEEKWRPPHQWARNPCRAWVRFLLVCPWIAAFSRYLALESAAVINVLSVAASVRLLHIFKTNLTQLGYARALELSIVAVGGIASLRKCTLLPLAEAFVVILVLLCAAWFQLVLPCWHANHQLRLCVLSAPHHPSGIRWLRTSLDAHTAASKDSAQRARDVLDYLEAIQALKERIAEPIRETDSDQLSSARERVERLSAHQLQLPHDLIPPLVQHAQEKARAMELLIEIERVTHLTDYVNLDSLRLKKLLDQARTNEWITILQDVLDNAASVLAKHAEYLRLNQSLEAAILLPLGEVEAHKLQSVLEMLTRPPFSCSASQLSGGHEKLKASALYQKTMADFEEACSRLDSDVDTWERLEQDAVLAGISSATIDHIRNCRHSCLQRNKLVEELKEVSRFPVALIDRSSLKELLKQAEESIWTVPPDLLQEAADLLQEAANSLQAAESCAQTVKQLHSLLQQNEVERLHVELSLSPPYVPVEEIALGQLAILLGRPPKNVCPHEIRKASDAVRAHYDPAAFNSIDSAPANHTPRHKCRLARPPWESDSKAIAHLLLSRAESLLGREETFKRQMNKIKKVADRDHNADRLEGLLKEAGDVIGDQQIEIRTLNDLLASVRRRDNLTLEIDRWMDLAKESRHTVSSDDFEKCLNDAREHGVPNAKCNEASLLIESVRLCEQVNQQLKELLATPPSQLISIHKCQQLIEEAVEAKAPPDEIQAARKVVKHVKIRLAAAKKLREAMSGLPVNLNLSDLMKAYEEAKNAQVSELQLDEALVKISILQDRARLLKSESETYQMLQNMLHRGTDPSSALTKRKLADVLSSAEGLCTQLQNQEMDHINLMKSVEAGRELLGHMHHSEAELRRCTQEADKCPKRIQNALNDAIKFNANKGLIERARELLKEINLRISKAEGELTSALQESRVKYTRLSKAIEEASAALKGVSDGNCTTKIKQLMDRANSALQRAKDRDTWQDRLEGFLQQKLNELSDLSNFKESLDMAKQLDADPELIRQGEVYLSRRQALDRDTTILKGTLRRKAASDEWIRSMNNALEEVRKNSDLPKCLIDDCHSALNWAKEKKQKPTPPPPTLASNWRNQLKSVFSGISDRLDGRVRNPPAWAYFLRELYTHFPHPKKTAEEVAEMLESLDAVKPFSKNMLGLLKTFAVFPYHPDRNLLYGEDWHALSTEISKQANAISAYYKERSKLVTN